MANFRFILAAGVLLATSLVGAQEPSEAEAI